MRHAPITETWRAAEHRRRRRDPAVESPGDLPPAESRKPAAELAAVLVDPMPLGIGMIQPRQGFLEFLREETARHGILLVADEVLNLRISYHGAAHAFGMEPDLASFGKIIGGGFPVGAVGGSRRVMSVFDHTGRPESPSTAARSTRTPSP